MLTKNVSVGDTSKEPQVRFSPNQRQRISNAINGYDICANLTIGGRARFNHVLRWDLLRYGIDGAGRSERQRNSVTILPVFRWRLSIIFQSILDPGIVAKPHVRRIGIEHCRVHKSVQRVLLDNNVEPCSLNLNNGLRTGLCRLGSILISKSTRTKIDFTKVMVIKQRGVLNSFAMFDCYMSASEIADEELRDIVHHQLAHCSMQPNIDGRLSWGATDAGWIISRMIQTGKL
ncbi:hypothetical protein [Bradyrhizobium nanningense]|uniref:hypothetical protein n=1 Tax=Bradyrhizobium nanningense TaxID=1325118 RepID=UPI001008FF89|nr:hypothetical protein [Bradyrhizobium nanningense]